MKTTKHYVGLDVHKDTVPIAVADEGRNGEVRIYGKISSDLNAIERSLRKIGGGGGELHVVYEAGPTGFVLYRRLKQLGIDCVVVAPSKTPQERGKRRKTDRRDAQMLARLHRAGELTIVHVPDEADEAIRDLTRARADAVHDLTRAKQRLKSFLLRKGYRYSGKPNWSEAHQRYLRELTLTVPALNGGLCLGDVANRELARRSAQTAQSAMKSTPGFQAPSPPPRLRRRLGKKHLMPSSGPQVFSSRILVACSNR